MPKRRVEPKRRRSFALNILGWLFGIGIPLILTYLGIVSYFPKLSLTFLEPLDKKDALSAPVELSNEGLFCGHEHPIHLDGQERPVHARQPRVRVR